MPLLIDSKTPAQRAAEHLLAGPQALFNLMFQQWRAKLDLLWKNPSPQAVLDEVGTNAAELFALSAQMAAFLETLKNGSTAAALAQIKPFTVNPDGTVTITPDEEPEA